MVGENFEVNLAKMAKQVNAADLKSVTERFPSSILGLGTVMRSNIRKGALLKCWTEQYGLCWYCELPVQRPIPGRSSTDPDRASFDHILPRSLGGTNVRTNLVMACMICNGNKAAFRVTIQKSPERIKYLMEKSIKKNGVF